MCFADDSTTNALVVYDDYMSNDEFSDSLNFMLAFYNFMFSMNRYCGIQDVVYDSVNWLAVANFTYADLISNFMMKLFTITGALNNVGLIFYTTELPPTSDSNSYFTIYQTVGLNIGNVLRIILGFKKVT